MYVVLNLICTHGYIHKRWEKFKCYKFEMLKSIKLKITGKPLNKTTERKINYLIDLNSKLIASSKKKKKL